MPPDPLDGALCTLNVPNGPTACYMPVHAKHFCSALYRNMPCPHAHYPWTLSHLINESSLDMSSISISPSRFISAHAIMKSPMNCIATAAYNTCLGRALGSQHPVPYNKSN